MVKKNNQNNNTESFVVHLTELRTRLTNSFIFLFFLLSCVIFFQRTYIVF